jgi:hypothetical protein
MGEKIICNPIPTVQDIIDKIKDNIKNPPDEIDINIKLTGIGAKRYYFIKKLLIASLNEEENEIDKYLIRSGVEQELLKLHSALAFLFKEDNV